MKLDTAGMCAQQFSNADDIGRSFFLQACLLVEQPLFNYKAKSEKAVIYHFSGLPRGKKNKKIDLVNISNVSSHLTKK